MEQIIRSTLLSEGPSDRTLLQIIRLTLAAHVSPAILVAEPQRADEKRLPLRVKRDRGKWVRATVEEYPCELLFAHRDADGAGRPKRLEEIAEWDAAAALPSAIGVTLVPVVPVRETEAWLLVEETAIRRAALNPNGTAPLNLPGPKRLERLADPKSVLAECLRIASGLSGARLRGFDVNKARGRVQLSDIGRLRALAAFAAFEQLVSSACSARGWSA
jgi:hypothetical protein